MKNKIKALIVLIIFSFGIMSFDILEKSSTSGRGQYWTCESNETFYCLTCTGWLFPDFKGLGPACNVE